MHNAHYGCELQIYLISIVALRPFILAVASKNGLHPMFILQ